VTEVESLENKASLVVTLINTTEACI